MEQIEIKLRLSQESIIALARVLNAEDDGDGYSVEDGNARLDVCQLIVAQASVVYGLKAPAVQTCVTRHYESWSRLRRAGLGRRLPKSKRPGAGHHAI
ncbi:MAG: hypothetical protein KGL39_17645 [Patescibacteria group bacterium]|nr:hypothetical protein [Patescibacteria group bacterium]